MYPFRFPFLLGDGVEADEEEEEEEEEEAEGIEDEDEGEDIIESDSNFGRVASTSDDCFSNGKSFFATREW